MGVFKDSDLEAVNALEQPWQGERLLQLRTGKIKPAFGIDRSAIFKNVRTGPVSVNSLGLEGDEHAFFLHGGPEKALLQYSSRHYSRWKQELAESSHLFAIGGFG